jgi:hypothetical protein
VERLAQRMLLQGLPAGTVPAASLAGAAVGASAATARACAAANLAVYASRLGVEERPMQLLLDAGRKTFRLSDD